MQITSIIEFPKTTSAVENYSASCLKKFTIHFRRPAKIKQKNNALYRGEYGFDWLRDEYVYPIEFVDMKETYPSNGDWVSVKKYTSLCQQPYFLKKEYLKDVKNPIKPYNKDYYPAWLAIYACNIEGNANSPMHNKGVDLNLQLDEIDSIINDGTEIILKPGKPCLKVNPERIPISKFIAQGKKTRILDQYSKEKINYYEIENAVNVICQGGTLDTHEEIKVFAKLGDTEIEVGKLMVYQNNIIPKLKVNLVCVVLDEDENGNKIIPDYESAINHLKNEKILTQALINLELLGVEAFDMLELAQTLSFETDLNDFITLIKNEKVMKLGIMPNGMNAAEYISKNIMKFYRKYSQLITSQNEGSVTIFFVGLNPLDGDVAGLTINSPNEKHYVGVTKEEKLLYQSYCFFFKSGLNNALSIKHEVGHIMGLLHIFQKLRDKTSISESQFYHSELNEFNIYSKITNNFIFYQGYTENIMDYNFKTVNAKPEQFSTLYTHVLNQYAKKMDSFYKWQWDLMRKSSLLKY